MTNQTITNIANLALTLSLLTAFLVASSAVSGLSVAIDFLINRYYSQLTIGSVTLNLALGPAIISVVTILFLFSLLRKKV